MCAPDGTSSESFVAGSLFKKPRPFSVQLLLFHSGQRAIRRGGWAEGSPGAGGSLGRVFNAGPTPAMRHPDTPTSTLTLKLRHFSARREASTLLRPSEPGVINNFIKLPKVRTKVRLYETTG